MNYFGDIRLGQTIDIKFTTVDDTGLPTTLAGTPVVSAYVGNGTTEITAGITLNADFDSRTGLNNVRVVASSGNGFATATDVILVITTGTIDGVSAVGYVIGSFSIENRSAVMPTVAARTLDVTATGAAGIDWANVENPTTTVELSGTTVGVVTLLNGIADGVLTAAKFAAGAFDAVWSVATRVLTAGTNIVLAKGTGVTGFNDLSQADVRSAVGLASANLDTQLSGLASDIAAVPDASEVQTAAAAALTAYDPPTNAEMNARTLPSADYFNPATDTVTVGTNNDKTGYAIGTGGIGATAFAAGAIDSAALAQSAGQEIADEILNRNIAGGGSGNTRNVRNALRALRNKVDGSTGTIVIYEEDDTTPAWSAALTRDTVDPIVTVG